MEQTAILTSKFQIHIPKKIREKAGFLTHGPVVMRADKGRIVIEKKKIGSILDLAGKYRNEAKKVNIDLANIRNYIDYGDL